MRLTRSHRDIAPEAYQNLLAQWRYTRSCGLEHGLLNLVEIRASQLNHCAYCLDMHVTEALEGGESPRRLATLAAWRETTWFTPRERAALAWTEALTLAPAGGADEALYQQLLAEFGAAPLSFLTAAIANINAWNRIAMALRFAPPLPGAARA